MDDIVDVFTETWGMKQPPVLISVTGAAQSEVMMKAKDRAIFERGLINAAKKTKAWIITGGTSLGVMKMVGSMVQNAGADAPVCLGVTPFGCVEGHENLANSQGRITSYPKSAATPHRACPPREGPRARGRADCQSRTREWGRRGRQG